MPRDNKRGRKKKRKPNRGSFRPVSLAGPDPRRHVFSRAECQLGLYIAYTNGDEDRKLWLKKKLFIYYSEKNNGETPNEKGERHGGQSRTEPDSGSGSGDGDAACPF